MKLIRVVKTAISEYLNEQQMLREFDNNDSFLSNYESAKKYAYDNIDGVAEAFDAFDENPDIHTSFSKDNYVDLINTYVNKYNELKSEDSVTIYRLIKLDTIGDLDVNDIGKHWSFEVDGVGAYGEQHPKRGMMKTGKPFILQGEVNPKHIDWIYGFSSFIWYGEDQWECALLKGARVQIISINNEELEQPLTAVVGDH